MRQSPGSEFRLRTFLIIFDQRRKSNLNTYHHMKKLFVVLALAGMVGSVSASTIMTVSGKSASIVLGDKEGEKKKDKKKKKKGGCCTSGGGCCKPAATAPAPAPAK
jgi:hypothetical protein